MSSSDSKYVRNEHVEEVDQYDSSAILSKIMLCKAILKLRWIKIKFVLTYRVNQLIWQSLCPKRAWRFWSIWLIYNTIQDNAKLKPPFKFGEWKWNPYWVIVLTSLSGSKYVPNEHEDVDQYNPYAIPFYIMQCQRHPVSLVNKNKNPYWHITLMNSSRINYILNEHDDFDQYFPFAMPSKIMPCHSYPASLVNQKWNPCGFGVLTSSSGTNYVP